MGFHFPVEPVTVNGNSSAAVGIGTEWYWTPINKIRIRGDVVMSTESTRITDKGLYVMFFLNRHVVAAGTHGVSEGWVF